MENEGRRAERTVVDGEQEQRSLSEDQREASKEAAAGTPVAGEAEQQESKISRR